MINTYIVVIYLEFAPAQSFYFLEWLIHTLLSYILSLPHFGSVVLLISNLRAGSVEASQSKIRPWWVIQYFFCAKFVIPSFCVTYVPPFVFPSYYFFDCARSFFVVVDKVFDIAEGMFFCVDSLTIPSYFFWCPMWVLCDLLSSHIVLVLKLCPLSVQVVGEF